MQQSDSRQIIPFSKTDEITADLIQRIVEENCQLRRITEGQAEEIDRMANTLAIQKELIQQLRDEIANLKGQKPKPKIPSSKLEGKNRKPDWHKKFGLYNGQGKSVPFSLWTKNLANVNSSPIFSHFSRIAIVTKTLQKRSLEVSKLAILVIRKVVRPSKPGQPKGKPRRKKRTILEVLHRSTVRL